MNQQLIKTILGGAILGAALFYLPFFILKVVVVFLLFGLLFRVFGWRRGFRGGYRGPYGWAYADKIRGMSDEEYSSFKDRMANSRCGYPSANTNDTTKSDEA